MLYSYNWMTEKLLKEVYVLLIITHLFKYAEGFILEIK